MKIIKYIHEDLEIRGIRLDFGIIILGLLFCDAYLHCIK